MARLTLKNAQDLVARADGDIVQSNMDFYYGDHWQGTLGWNGPIVAPNDPEFANVASEIERAFVSKNSIKEVVDRAVNGVLGREPLFTLEGTNADEAKKL